jgi:putative transposase
VDAEVVATIRTSADDRPTYGCRRIGAVLNQQREQARATAAQSLTSLQTDVAKRPLAATLKLQPARASERRADHHNPPRTSDGRRTPSSTTPVTPRSIRGWQPPEAFPGDDPRSVALEREKPRRCTTNPLPHREWLSDNGGCYRAYETISLTQSIGLLPFFMPV